MSSIRITDAPSGTRVQVGSDVHGLSLEIREFLCAIPYDAQHGLSEGVRERTRLLIKHASFVVADLTLGYENPDHENPSRGHEIGLAVAYDRPLMLCSQEPRRVPYFSIADMQMAFWETESQLRACPEPWPA